MKPLVALLTAALLALGVAACGSSNGASSASSAAATAAGSSKLDRDNDNDNNDDDNHVLYYGHEAAPTDRQAIIALLTHYYAAAATNDGAKACPLLMSYLAEAVVEEMGHIPKLRGKSCAVVMSKLFKPRHALLSGENASLKVLTVRVEGDRALTVLSFANLPEVRQMTERLDGNSGWKIVTLLDGILE
ncbi:MAG: hypothetical protein ACRDJ3_06220 [Solirubrobacteraceae bacterium]